MQKFKKSQSGFTLIELVVVIVILGILAATALPKFVDLSSDARGGVIKGVETAMRAADTMIYAKAAAAGIADKNSDKGGATPVVKVKVNGSDVYTKFGYAADIEELAKVITLNPASDFTTNTTDKRIEHAKATTVATCSVTYAAAASNGGAPTYTTATDGC